MIVIKEQDLNNYDPSIKTIKTMDELALNNIRQINKHTNLDFNSALRSLLNDSYSDKELEEVFNSNVSYKNV